ncbi:MAG: M23 family metallopeptidase [Parvularculaceae bacterium]
MRGAIALASLAALIACDACATAASDRRADARTEEPGAIMTRDFDRAIQTTATPEKPTPPPLAIFELENTNMLARRADFAEAMQQVEKRQKVFKSAPERFTLEGHFAQGGLAFGHTEPGATVRLDGADVMVDEGGRFVIGFERDNALTALLVITLPDGTVERQALEIEDRDFPVQRIDGLDQSKVSGFTEEQLAKIAVDSEKKKAARQTTQEAADWAGGFDWPIKGVVSGVFGSQRILNGEPKRPHSGVDVAAPEGALIRAPADGIVRLAEPDMYFEGGLVLIDHGHWLESAIMHMSRLDVRPGQHVAKGAVIGAVGATGRATGPHMHWSVKWTGRLVDPQLLAGAMPATKGAQAD